MLEIWKPVPYEPFSEKYLISNLGNVKPIKKSKYSPAKGEFLKPGFKQKGYKHVTFYHDGQKKQADVHRMVALAFIGQPPEGKNLVCHLDDNKLNNIADNLIWGDNADNMRHMVEHRRSLVGSKNPRALLNDVKVRTIRRLYAEGGVSQTSLALQFGVNQTIISKVIRRQSWKNVL